MYMFLFVFPSEKTNLDHRVEIVKFSLHVIVAGRLNKVRRREERCRRVALVIFRNLQLPVFDVFINGRLPQEDTHTVVGPVSL